MRLQDVITQLQKFDSLPAETEKAVDKARALIKDSASSRQVRRLCYVRRRCEALLRELRIV